MLPIAPAIGATVAVSALLYLPAPARELVPGDERELMLALWTRLICAKVERREGVTSEFVPYI